MLEPSQQQKDMLNRHAFRSIVRCQVWFARLWGKAGKPGNLGPSWTLVLRRLDPSGVLLSTYNEAGNLRAMVERFCAREGHYPAVFWQTKFTGTVKISACKERGIRLSGPALGRPRKDEIQDKAQNYLDEFERVEVERRFSLAKRHAAWDWLLQSCRKPLLMWPCRSSC